MMVYIDPLGRVILIKLGATWDSENRLHICPKDLHGPYKINKSVYHATPKNKDTIFSIGNSPEPISDVLLSALSST